MNRIKAIRLGLHMKQQDLARAAGVSSPFLHDLENGNRNAKPETWQKIADQLGCTVDDLKGGQGDGTAAECV